MGERLTDALCLAVVVTALLQDLDRVLRVLKGGPHASLGTIATVHAVFLLAVAAAYYRLRPRITAEETAQKAGDQAPGKVAPTSSRATRALTVLYGILITCQVGLIGFELAHGGQDERLVHVGDAINLTGLAALVTILPREAHATPRRHALFVGLLLLAAGAAALAAF